MHLISTYRYPLLQTLSIETTVDYLLQAAKIVREVSAVAWTFLETPQDGTVMLAWQPESRIGTRFASDGYIWADPEKTFIQAYRGYVSDRLFWLFPRLKV